MGGYRGNNYTMPEVEKNDWLEKASHAYESSTSYIDTNYRSKWEDNIRHFQSKHKAASKYNKDAYKHRSKIFRPKTRSNIRNKEAAAAGVFFSNQDLTSIEARNPSDIRQVVSAEINRELINYRLTESIPWFMTVIGAFQDGQVLGVVCSYQYWDYEEKEIPYDITDELGNKIGEDIEKRVVVDKPCVDLRPIENIRIHPNADWRDPIGTSPYIIDLIPMYVCDIKAMFKKNDPKTNQSKWKKCSDGQLIAAKKELYDTTRSVRDDEREDKTDSTNSEILNDYDIVWVHRNIMKDESGDVVFYTLGTEHMLTDATPIEEEYPHCEDGSRPYTMGVGAIEAHKLMPDSSTEIGTPLQQEINENVNQRLDNVKLVLNKRYFVKRGGQVDLPSLLRNVAGGITMMNDTSGDVKTVDYNDITSSAYQEQDRLNADYDGLVGDFSTSSVMTNRKLGETVGGMNMLRGGANSLTEYILMVFSETWVEPTIKQLVKLEQYYETDETVLAIAAEKAKLWQRYQIGSVTDEILKQDLNITVNVGFGATDQQTKLEKFLLGIGKAVEIRQVTAQMQNPPDMKAVDKEIFGKLGYKDGSRFFPQEEEQQNPMAVQLQQMQQMIQQLQVQLQDKQADRENKLQLAQVKEDAQNKRHAADLHVDIFKEFNKDLPVESVPNAIGGMSATPI